MKENIIMDCITILKDGTVDLKKDGDVEELKKVHEEMNININMYFELYKTGELAEICEYITEHQPKDAEPAYAGSTDINFIIDRNKLTEEKLQELDERFPGNTLRASADYVPCIYTHCIGLNYRVHKAYRSNCGCVGSTWEHPFVYYMPNETCYKLQDMKPLEAAMYTIQWLWGEEKAA